jgi:dolichol-phosphate mannosyltransferase
MKPPTPGTPSEPFSTRDLSIVIPFYNEEECAGTVLGEARQTLEGSEIIAVDDGSRDRTWNEIESVRGVRGIRFFRNHGQSAAMYYGLRAATRRVVGLMDGDGQNHPAGFHALLAEFSRAEAEVICGVRRDRQDRWTRRIGSRLANAIRRAWLDDGVLDTGCSQKVFPREAVDLLVPFRGMHRYVPAILQQAGLRVSQLTVEHRSRIAGTSKYSNWNRAVEGIYDLIGVRWLLSRKFAEPQMEVTP